MQKPEDLTITCIDCNKDFLFSIGEQEFFKKKGLFQPRRCPACRIKKRTQKLAEEAAKSAV